MFLEDILLRVGLDYSRSTAAAARNEGRSSVTHTPGKRGAAVSSGRSGSDVLSDAAGKLGTAGREGTLTSEEQDVRETASRAHLRILSHARVADCQCQHYCRSVSE